MKYSKFAFVAVVAFAAPAWADHKAQSQQAQAKQETKSTAQAPAQQKRALLDLTKIGPASRKPTNVQQTKQEIEEFYRKTEQAYTKGGLDAVLGVLDFPVYMVTDDSKGVPFAGAFTRDQYIAMVKPIIEIMPKDIKVDHNLTITVLSDSLAVVTDAYSATTGKQMITGQGGAILVKRDGQWKFKAEVAAGWGDTHVQQKR